MAFRDNARGNLRDLVESHGVQSITNILIEQLQEGKLKPDEMRLRELWDAYTNFANPATPVLKLEAVTTGALPTVTGELINAKIIAGYDMPGLIGNQLVTTIPSKLKEDKIAGFTDVAGAPAGRPGRARRAVGPAPHGSDENHRVALPGLRRRSARA